MSRRNRVDLPVDACGVQALGDGVASVRHEAVKIDLAKRCTFVPEAAHPLHPPQQIDGSCVSWLDAIR